MQLDAIFYKKMSAFHVYNSCFSKTLEKSIQQYFNCFFSQKVAAAFFFFFFFFLESYDFYKSKIHCAKKQGFPLRISSVSATKSEGN